MGYGVNAKGYRVWIPNTNVVETVRDIIILKKNEANMTDYLKNQECFAVKRVIHKKSTKKIKL